MSLARYDIEERDHVAYARCPRQPRDVYAPKLYLGTQRGPRRVDGELGAICVIDLLLGGRIAIFAIAGDDRFRRVERLE